jgi:hypothetical protein
MARAIDVVIGKVTSDPGMATMPRATNQQWNRRFLTELGCHSLDGPARVYAFALSIIELTATLLQAYRSCPWQGRRACSDLGQLLNQKCSRSLCASPKNRQCDAGCLNYSNSYPSISRSRPCSLSLVKPAAPPTMRCRPLLHSVFKLMPAYCRVTRGSSVSPSVLSPSPP